MQILNKMNRTACLTVALLALGLAGCASHKERTASQYWSDKMTTRRVNNALESSSTFKYPGVTVTTFDGTVSLGGFVNTEAQKHQATELARNVEGVRQVLDNLIIKIEPTGRAPVLDSPEKVNPSIPPASDTRDTNAIANPNP